MKTKIILLSVISCILFLSGFSQDFNEAYLDSIVSLKAKSLVTKNSRFALVGYTTVALTADKDNGAQFGGFTFNPIFLWKPHDKIFVEAELETELEGEETKIDLEYINASFVVNKYITVRAGKFLAPFGIYQDRLHPGWINKMPDAPLGFGHDGIGPSAELGIDIRGGVPLGPMKMNYSIYVSQGPQLNEGDEEPGEEGNLMYGNAKDNNKNKAVGGRLGFLPFSNSSLEVGGSFQYAKPGTKGTEHEKLKAFQYGADFSYVKQLSFLKGTVDVKAQWNYVQVDNADYEDPEDTTGTGTYTFDNKSQIVFAQFAYRPSMLRVNYLKNFELTFRYSYLQPIKRGDESEIVNQYTVGLNYWINWRTVAKVAYQRNNSSNGFVAQIAVGF